MAPKLAHMQNRFLNNHQEFGEPVRNSLSILRTPQYHTSTTLIKLQAAFARQTNTSIDSWLLSIGAGGNSHWPSVSFENHFKYIHIRYITISSPLYMVRYVYKIRYIHKVDIYIDTDIRCI